MHDASITVTVQGDPRDPRIPYRPPPGVDVRFAAPLHPDDVTVVRGIPVTTPERTLIDLAEDLDEAELRSAFARALELRLVDRERFRAARARVEWRPSLVLLDRVAAGFLG